MLTQRILEIKLEVLIFSEICDMNLVILIFKIFVLGIFNSTAIIAGLAKNFLSILNVALLLMLFSYTSSQITKSLHSFSAHWWDLGLITLFFIGSVLAMS